MDQISIIQPDDWHLHLRDGQRTGNHCAGGGTRLWSRYYYAQPNPTGHYSGCKLQLTRERILAQRPEGSTWEPLMVLYLTDNTDPDEIRAAKECGFIQGCKYYPAGATTNSDSGVTDLANIRRCWKPCRKWAWCCSCTAK